MAKSVDATDLIRLSLGMETGEEEYFIAANMDY